MATPTTKGMETCESFEIQIQLMLVQNALA